MTQKEMRLNRIVSLNEKLAQKYESIEVSGRRCFLINNGLVCRIDNIGGGHNALVIEYADSLEMAKKNIFEDGDLFYMDDMAEGEMLEAMLKEINA